MMTLLNDMSIVDKMFAKNGIVNIFNRALSASEIQAIYNAGSAGQTKP